MEPMSNWGDPELGGKRPELSIVSPVYLGESSLDLLVDEIKLYASHVTEDFEIVLVDDGSPDSSWRRIESQCKRDPRVRGLQLSRNFGQHQALTAGLESARGRYVVVLDCDMQDHPKYIPALYEKALEGYDVVYTRKAKREHRGKRNLFGAIFHRTLNLLVSDRQARTDSVVGNYSILSRRVVDAFLRLNDRHRHYLGLLRWLGFDHTYIEIEHFERAHGKSSYTFRRLVREAITGITSQSQRLLRLSIVGGFICVGLSFLAVIGLVAAYFISGFREGWTSVVVLQLLSTGVILMSLGIAGIYIGQIFDQVKARPLYLVKTTLNLDDFGDGAAPRAGGFVGATSRAPARED
jgi:polyisoprenyl-phosphate glycosyltransferase